MGREQGGWYRTGRCDVHRQQQLTIRSLSLVASRIQPANPVMLMNAGSPFSWTPPGPPRPPALPTPVRSPEGAEGGTAVRTSDVTWSKKARELASEPDVLVVLPLEALLKILDQGNDILFQSRFAKVDLGGRDPEAHLERLVQELGRDHLVLRKEESKETSAPWEPWACSMSVLAFHNMKRLTDSLKPLRDLRMASHSCRGKKRKQDKHGEKGENLSIQDELSVKSRRFPLTLQETRKNPAVPLFPSPCCAQPHSFQ